MFICNKCGGSHLSSTCLELNSNPFKLKTEFNPIIDFPKPSLDFFKPKNEYIDNFNFERKKYFDGGANNIMQQQKFDLGPLPGAPRIMDNPGTRPLNHTVAPPPIPGRPPIFM
jgi:hypothetical protein